jgi:uncharacterized protein YjcR
MRPLGQVPKKIKNPWLSLPKRRQLINEIANEILQKYGYKPNLVKIYKRKSRWYVEAINPRDKFLEQLIVVEIARYDEIKNMENLLWGGGN